MPRWHAPRGPVRSQEVRKCVRKGVCSGVRTDALNILRNCAREYKINKYKKNILNLQKQNRKIQIMNYVTYTYNQIRI